MPPSPCYRLPGVAEGPIESMGPPTRPDAYGHHAPTSQLRCRGRFPSADLARECAHLRGCPRKRFTALALRCPRPPHPALRYQTIRESPLSSDRIHFNTAIPNSDKAKYFCSDDLTEFWMVGLICPPGRCCAFVAARSHLSASSFETSADRRAKRRRSSNGYGQAPRPINAVG